MKIETELDVGDVIWVPRVYPDMHLDSVVVDGKTYWASQEDAIITYKPVVKQKIITEIEITIKRGCLDIIYFGVTAGAQVTNMDNVVYRSGEPRGYFKTEQEALDFAVKKAMEGKPYYG